MESGKEGSVGGWRTPNLSARVGLKVVGSSSRT